MGRVVVEAEEERPVAMRVRVDVVDGGIGEKVGEIAVLVDRAFAVVQVGLPALAEVRVVAGMSAADPEEMFISAVERTMPGCT